MHVESSGDLTDESRKVLLGDVGHRHIGDLSRKLFLASDEVGTGCGNARNRASCYETFARKATVETGGLFLQRCRNPERSLMNWLALTKISLTALSGFRTLVDDTASSPITTCL